MFSQTGTLPPNTVRAVGARRIDWEGHVPYMGWRREAHRPIYYLVNLKVTDHTEGPEVDGYDIIKMQPKDVRYIGY
jgi:hypothetical protein